jgi:hypothetical protein
MKMHEPVSAFSVEPHKFVRSFCPRCNDLMVAPAMSQFVDEDVVRHLWACEACGHEFGTTVEFRLAASKSRRRCFA